MPSSRGRPTDYTPELAARICEKVAGGLSVRRLARLADMPARATIHRWAALHAEFGDQLARAYELRGEQEVDEGLDELQDLVRRCRLADGGKGKEVSRTQVRAAIALADFRFRRAAQLSPKKLGPLLRVAGHEGGALPLIIRRQRGKPDA